jgi:hypothetical protein
MAGFEFSESNGKFGMKIRVQEYGATLPVPCLNVLWGAVLEMAID